MRLVALLRGVTPTGKGVIIKKHAYVKRHSVQATTMNALNTNLLERRLEITSTTRKLSTVKHLSKWRVKPMIDIENKSYQPSVSELCEFVENPIFDELCHTMDSEYQALKKIEYSGDNVLLGWNLKFKKAGRTLCTVYPRHGHFPMLLIVGRKEKERVEVLLPSLSEEFRQVYHSTQEGMGQRWLLLDFSEHTDAYDDALKIIRIRRESI